MGDVRCGMRKRCGKPNLYLCQYSPVKSCRTLPAGWPGEQCKQAEHCTARASDALCTAMIGDAHDKENTAGPGFSLSGSNVQVVPG